MLASVPHYPKETSPNVYAIERPTRGSWAGAHPFKYLDANKHIFRNNWSLDFYESAGSEAGVMLPWGPGWSQRSSAISDRFFLGGVGSLRGFRTRSVGPTDVRHAHTPSGGGADGGSARAAQVQLP